MRDRPATGSVGVLYRQSAGVRGCSAVSVHPSHSWRMSSRAVAACSSSRSTQQFPICGLSTMIPVSLVKSRFVKSAAPCVWQAVVITRRCLLRAVLPPFWIIAGCLMCLRSWTVTTSRHDLLVGEFGGPRVEFRPVNFMGAPGVGVRRSALLRCWWWIASDGLCRPDAGCLDLLKRWEAGWHRAATSVFSETDVALRLLTCRNR